MIHVGFTSSLVEEVLNGARILVYHTERVRKFLSSEGRDYVSRGKILITSEVVTEVLVVVASALY